MVYGRRYLEYGIRNTVNGIWNMELGYLVLKPNTFFVFVIYKKKHFVYRLLNEEYNEFCTPST
jgi:hypothetical protein